MLKQLINQQQQAMHNTLQRTISHPMHSLVQQQQQQQQHHPLSFVMDNLNGQQQNLNGCGDAQPQSAAVAAALAHRKLERTQSEPLPQQQQLVNTSR